MRKSLKQILKKPFEYLLILSGDQLYNIDFEKMIEWAIEKNADLTIATLPVIERDATRFGILKIDNEGTIVDFIEKPKEKPAAKELEKARERKPVEKETEKVKERRKVEKEVEKT